MLTINELGELSNPDDFEPPRLIKLKKCDPSSLSFDEPEPHGLYGTRTCPECFGDFEPLDRRQVYCSDRCKKDARNRRRRKCD